METDAVMVEGKNIEMTVVNPLFSLTRNKDGEAEEETKKDSGKDVENQIQMGRGEEATQHGQAGGSQCQNCSFQQWHPNLSSPTSLISLDPFLLYIRFLPSENPSALE